MPRMPDRLPADPRRSAGTGQVRVELEMFGVVPVVLRTECPMSDPNRMYIQPPLVGFSVLRCKPAITTDSHFADHSIGA